MTTATVYAAALRAHARGWLSKEASVELLIASGWLRRRDFQQRYIDYTDDPDITGGEPLATIQWDRVVTAIAVGGFPACSSGELQMIKCAAGLAGYGDWPLRNLIDSLDATNLTLVMEAMAHLRGWHERSARATITGDVGGQA